MSKPANKTLIGAFVVGALVLAVAAVIIFGSGKLFRDKAVVVMYFDGSVKGLNVGSPVVFRGVRIGSVVKMELLYKPKDLAFLIPVYAELDLDKIRVVGEEPEDEQLGKLIAKGFRAQLELQSMVTGQLMINLDFFPDKPTRFVALDRSVAEIPTIPSDLDEFIKSASELPLKDLIGKLMHSIEGIDKAVNSPRLAESLESLSGGLQQAKQILVKIDREIDPMLVNLRDSSASFSQLIKKSEGVPKQIDEALVSAQTTLKQAEKTLLSVQGIASENSTIVMEVDSTLQEVSKTARSVRFLTDYLQRHPEAILKGKPPVKGE